MSQRRVIPKPRAVAIIDRVAVRHIILIDQAPLRHSTAAHCTSAMARLTRARAGWHRFEREDKPAFVRWRAREFGPFLSQARDVELQIRECQALVHEVEMEMRRGFQDAHSAYQRVMFRRENPGAYEDENGPPPSKPGATRSLSEFEQEALFQEWVQRSLGTNPDKMDDDAYSTTFEAFKSHMFRIPPDEPQPRKSDRAQKARVAANEAEEEKEGGTPGVDLRVKELYRILVRRLHPDLRADGNAAVSALWHEVQESYGASDVARMEILLALSDIETNHMGDATSLFQMRSVLAELQRALRALEKSLLEAQGDESWNFARTGPDEAVRLRVHRQLKSDLATRTARLDLLTRTIAAWAQGAIANRKITHARDRQSMS